MTERVLIQLEGIEKTYKVGKLESKVLSDIDLTITVSPGTKRDPTANRRPGRVFVISWRGGEPDYVASICIHLIDVGRATRESREDDLASIR